MKLEDIKIFFEQMYADKTGQTLSFKNVPEKLSFYMLGMKEKHSIFYDTLSHEEALRVWTVLQKILPKCAHVELVESSDADKLSHVVITNPKAVFSVFVTKIAESLNRYYPIPVEDSSKSLYQWESYRLNPVELRYVSGISTGYLIDSAKYVENQKNNKAIIAYNDQLKVLYPDLDIRVEIHREGNVYVIEHLSYSSFLAITVVPSLCQLGINFFKNTPELCTPAMLAKLHKELRDEIISPVT